MKLIKTDRVSGETFCSFCERSSEDTVGTWLCGISIRICLSCVREALELLELAALEKARGE